jgi:hypothetical protein
VDQEVGGSSPPSCTKKFLYLNFNEIFCSMPGGLRVLGRRERPGNAEGEKSALVYGLSLAVLPHCGTGEAVMS